MISSARYFTLQINDGWFHVIEIKIIAFKQSWYLTFWQIIIAQCFIKKHLRGQHCCQIAGKLKTGSVFCDNICISYLDDSCLSAEWRKAFLHSPLETFASDYDGNNLNRWNDGDGI